MYDPNKGFDPYEFVFGNNNTSPWNSSYLNDYIRDTIMKSFNSPFTASSSWDFSKVNDYIQNIMIQSLNRHLSQFMNQPDTTSPAPLTEREEVNELSEYTPTEEPSSIESDPDNSAPTLDELIETPLSANQIRSNDFQIETEKPDLREETTFRTQSYTRNIGIQPEIMHTHSMVIIRVELPEGMSEKDLKISINDDHAVIKWPARYMEQLIPLPAGIIRSHASAMVKDTVLEIQIPRKHEGEVREIGI